MIAHMRPRISHCLVNMATGCVAGGIGASLLLGALDARRVSRARSAAGSTGVNFETDALRFTYDALLREYDTLRREIELMLNQQERTYNYLLALIGAIIASQVLVTQAASLPLDIAQEPTILLAVGLLLLWFPIQNLVLNSHIATIAVYLRSVLIPKIDHICTIDRSVASQAFADWESRSFEAALIGSLKWELFRSSVQFERTQTMVLLAPLWVYRQVILTIPSLAMFGFFIILRWSPSSINWSNVVQPALLVLTAIFLVSYCLVALGRANLFRVHKGASRRHSNR